MLKDLLDRIRSLVKMFKHIVENFALYPDEPYRLNERISGEIRQLCRILRRHPEFITASELRILCSTNLLDAEEIYLILVDLFHRVGKAFEEDEAKPSPYPKREETEEKNVFPPVRPRLTAIDLKLMSGLPVPY